MTPIRGKRKRGEGRGKKLHLPLLSSDEKSNKQGGEEERA